MSLYLIVSGEVLTTGGQDRANHALASWLARQGNEVHLVAHDVSSDLLRQGDVIWHRAPKPLGSTLLGEPFLQRIGRRIAAQLALRGARVIVNGGNCDFADVNWVHYVHAAHQRQTEGALRKLRYRISHARFVRGERRAVSRARVVIVNSKRTARDLTDRVGIDPDRIHPVYYGIDPDIFRPPSAAERASPRRSAVLFIGALGDRRKGFDVVFKAWEMLCRDPDWDVELRVMGRGSQLPLWQARARDAGLGQRVQFLGFRSDVPELMRAADALVAPTRYEAYGLGVHEAVCCGLPAFVSADAGVAERYPADLRELLIPDPENADDLARRLKRWHSEPAGFRDAVARFAGELRARTWDDMSAEIQHVVKLTPGLVPASRQVRNPLESSVTHDR